MPDPVVQEDLLATRLAIFDSHSLLTIQSLLDRFTDKDAEAPMVATLISMATGAQALSQPGLAVLFAAAKKVLPRVLKIVQAREAADPAQVDATDVAKLKRVHPGVDVAAILKTWAQPQGQDAKDNALDRIAMSGMQEGIRVTLSDVLKSISESPRFAACKSGLQENVQRAFQTGLLLVESTSSGPKDTGALARLMEYVQVQVSSTTGLLNYRRAIREFAAV